MKLREAMEIIERGPGFMVAFEERDGALLKSDHFPDKHGGEMLLASEDEAWDLAFRFARKMGTRICNVYVIDDQFRPVAGYESKILNRIVRAPRIADQADGSKS